jgi:hypothetical protein
MPGTSRKTARGYDPMYALVADPVVHRCSGLGTLSLLHAEREGTRASVKDPPVVEIAKDVTGGNLTFAGTREESARINTHWGGIDLSMPCDVCGQDPLNSWMERFGKRREQPNVWTLLPVVDRLQLHLPPVSHIFPLLEFGSNCSVDVVPDLVKQDRRKQEISHQRQLQPESSVPTLENPIYKYLDPGSPAPLGIVIESASLHYLYGTFSRPRFTSAPFARQGVCASENNRIQPDQVLRRHRSQHFGQ